MARVEAAKAAEWQESFGFRCHPLLLSGVILWALF